MSRKQLFPRFAVFVISILLCPDASAQQLTKCEYWFDNNISNRSAISISGYETDLETGIDIRQLGDGLHTICLRVQQSDGSYSPVTSSVFLKFAPGNKSVLEYWFDDNIQNSHSKSVEFSDSTEMKSIVLDLQDDDRFPIGLHRLNYRVAADGNHYSTIYCDEVMKISSGSVCKLEYWFDNDIGHMATAEMASIDELENYNLQLDLRDKSSFPNGEHMLNMRVLTEGNVYSPVYSTWIFDMATGKPEQLEYWIDDDYSNSKAVTGVISGDNITFDSELKLEDVTPGYHRLFLRANSNSRRNGSMVSVFPIMAKSQYYTDVSDLRIEKFGVWIDNEAPQLSYVGRFGYQITQPYTVDANGYTDGVHKLNYSFVNSAGLQVTESADFRVGPVEIPSVSLRVTEQNGIVNLQCNSVPNDRGYCVYRIDENGNSTIVSRANSSTYPNRIEVTDNPLAGSYSYRIKVSYYKSDKSVGVVSSEDVPVIVGQTRQESDKFGSIIGRVSLFDANGNVVHHNDKLDIVFSDGFAVTTQSGNFYRSGLPIGQEMTVAVSGADGYSFDETPFIVEKLNKVHIKGYEIENGHQTDMSNYIIRADSKIIWTEDELSLTVRNCSWYFWHGEVYAFAYEKTAYDQMMNADGNVNETLRKYPLGTKKPMLGSGESIDLSWSLKPIRSQTKDTEFYVFLTYKGKDSEEQLVYVDNSNGCNPMVISQSGEHRTHDPEEECDELVKVFKEIYENTKAVTADIDSPLGIMKGLAKAEEGDNIETFVARQSVNVTSNIMQLLCEDYAKAIREVKNFEKLNKYINEFTGYLNTSRELAGISTSSSKDKNVLFFKYCGKLFEYCTTDNPFLKIYLLYFETGERMAEVIARYAEKLYIANLPQYLSDGCLTIRLHILQKGLFNKPFDHTLLNSDYPLIVDAKIHLWDTMGYDHTFDVKADYSNEDYIEFSWKNVNDAIGSGYNVSSMILSITWNNGRYLRIPLVLEDDYEAVALGGNTNHPYLDVYLRADTKNEFLIPSKGLTIGKKGR